MRSVASTVGKREPTPTGGFASGSTGQNRRTEPASGSRRAIVKMNQCRIRTTSKRSEVRFLYVTIRFLLRNLWVWLHHAVLSKPRRSGGELHLERLRLRTMLLWLFEVTIEMYGPASTIPPERPLPYTVTSQSPEGHQYELLNFESWRRE